MATQNYIFRDIHNEKNKENGENSTVFWFSWWVVPVHQVNLSISWNNLFFITIKTEIILVYEMETGIFPSNGKKRIKT